MISPLRLKIIVGAVFTFILFQWLLKSGMQTIENSSVSWLHSALIARSNSRMEITQRGEGALVKMNRKIIIETDKSPVAGIISIHKFGFVLGLDEPDFIKSYSEALVGLKEGALIRIPAKDLKIKILKVCHDKLPDSSKCEIQPLDGPAATKLNICMDPTTDECHNLLTKLMMAGRIEHPEFIFTEFCVVASEFDCLKLIEAISIVSKKYPSVGGRFAPVAQESELYLSDHNKIKLQEIVLKYGSVDMANNYIEMNPEDLNSGLLLKRLDAAYFNPPVYEKMIDKYVKIITQKAYNAERLIQKLKESGAKLPPELERAIEVYQRD